MFYHMTGKVTELGANLAVLDCHGIGYALNVTGHTLPALKIGEQATLYICEQIREDAFELYGFADKREKRCFEMLIGVSGVGPKAALSILSAATPESLAMAVISGDERTLTVAPGIGKKIAQRVLLELKDKMSKEMGGLELESAPAAGRGFGSSKLSDAASALAVLGYASTEISKALKGIDIDNTPLEDIIRQALKTMSMK